MSNYEKIIYGSFCFPCLFGDTQAKMKIIEGYHNPSCYPGCFTYIVMLVLGDILGLSTSIACENFNPLLSILCGDFCGRLYLGLYAGNNRSQLKNIIGITPSDINNNECNDYMIHMFCSPCAIWKNL